MAARKGNVSLARPNAEYPIAKFPDGFLGDPIVDIGSVALGGAGRSLEPQAGHRIIGVDARLRALLCAQELSRKLVPSRIPSFVLAEARVLPFAAESVVGAFSYSVLQHFSKGEHDSLTTCLEARSPFADSNAEPERFAVVIGFGASRIFRRARVRRYYSIGEVSQLFSQHIGRSDWSVDCFLGLNVHAYDRKFVRPSRRLVIDIAEAQRRKIRGGIFAFVPQRASLSLALFNSL
jgi:hypothetical protein